MIGNKAKHVTDCSRQKKERPTPKETGIMPKNLAMERSFLHNATNRRKKSFQFLHIPTHLGFTERNPM
jgi:hypothetical protein